jgi:hypothetical protein
MTPGRGGQQSRRRRPGLKAALGETEADGWGLPKSTQTSALPFVIDRALADDVRRVEEQPRRHPFRPNRRPLSGRSLMPQPVLRNENIDNAFSQ